MKPLRAGIFLFAALLGVLVFIGANRMAGPPQTAPEEEGAAGESGLEHSVSGSEPAVQLAEYPEGEEAPAEVLWGDVERHLNAFNHWQVHIRERGYFTSEELSGYSGYSRATLQALAEEGDLLALDLLLDKVVADGDIERATTLHWMGAAYGSTKLLIGIAVGEVASLKTLGLEEDDAMLRESLLGALSWLEVARRRGDPFAASWLQQRFERHDIELSSNERRLFEEMAERRHAELLNIRHALGLGDFDDRISDDVDAVNAFVGGGAPELSALPNP
ncbi:hypothetical protein [Marinimicrobium alkaliphilum]|uniref:hypothetical protein n=1 Tax=Marinimicrobium alkaliphilum TaxID=2202654 RepID=UPI000DBA2AE0|nr:hypothetical protein [Marinimicrobium alkaliphilum]